jgi:hypothetical protein
MNPTSSAPATLLISYVEPLLSIVRFFVPVLTLRDVNQILKLHSAV